MGGVLLCLLSSGDTVSYLENRTSGLGCREARACRRRSSPLPPVGLRRQRSSSGHRLCPQSRRFVGIGAGCAAAAAVAGGGGEPTCRPLLAYSLFLSPLREEGWDHRLRSNKLFFSLFSCFVLFFRVFHLMTWPRRVK